MVRRQKHQTPNTKEITSPEVGMFPFVARNGLRLARVSWLGGWVVQPPNHLTTQPPSHLTTTRRRLMTRWLTSPLSVLGISLCTGYLGAAEPPRVLELRTQKVGETTYFQVRLERPANLRMPTFDTSKPFSEADRRRFAALPRMVPQDEKTRAVYYRHKTTQPGLSFCGQVSGEGKG